MAESRKVFPMETFAAYLKGSAVQGYNKSVNDLLCFMTQQDVDKESQLFAAALSKAYIYEQHPELTKVASHELTRLGDSVSVSPLPDDVMEVAGAVFAKLEEYRQTIATQAAALAEMEVKAAETKKTITQLEGKVKDYEKMNKAGEEKIVASKSKVEDYMKKVDELLAKIEEVKKHGVVTVAGGGAAAPAGDAGADTGATAEPEGDFGFGMKQGGDDFGF
jgi:predicted ribosome quality control (RQC) complex YloA/Tae2 family protein